MLSNPKDEQFFSELRFVWRFNFKKGSHGREAIHEVYNVVFELGDWVPKLTYDDLLLSWRRRKLYKILDHCFMYTTEDMLD